MILRELATWREETARERNRPRPWILPDETLINIAQKKPLTVSDLESIKGLSDKAISRYGKIITGLVEKGLTAAEKEPGKQPVPRDGEESLNARVDFALSYLKGKSMAEGIDHALVASRADVTALVRDRKTAAPKDHRLLRGWRKEFMGKELLQLLSGKLAVRLDPKTGLPSHASNK